MTLNKIDTYKPLYKRDSKGKVRVWYMEIGANTDQTVWGHRAVAGLEDGERVTNAWKTVSPKNVGKANETSPQAQAEQEIVSLYTKKLDTGYSDTPEAVDTHEYFKPMLAETYGKKGLTGDIYQPKFDGMRSISKNDGIWSRTGNAIVSVPHIKEHLASFFAAFPDAVIDGELYNHEYRDRFESLMSILRKEKLEPEHIQQSAEVVKLYFYDGYLDEESKSLPFKERYAQLISAVNDHYGEEINPLVCVGYAEGDADEYYARWIEEGYEGQIVRTNDKPYEHKRSKSVLKRKEFVTAEFVVEDVLEGQGNWSGYAKHLVLKSPVQSEDSENTFKSGMRGSQGALKKVLEDARSGKAMKWATIRFFGYTAYGVPRFPVAIDWGYEERRND